LKDNICFHPLELLDGFGVNQQNRTVQPCKANCLKCNYDALSCQACSADHELVEASCVPVSGVDINTSVPVAPNGTIVEPNKSNETAVPQTFELLVGEVRSVRFDWVDQLIEVCLTRNIQHLRWSIEVTLSMMTAPPKEAVHLSASQLDLYFLGDCILVVPKPIKHSIHGRITVNLTLNQTSHKLIRLQEDSSILIQSTMKSFQSVWSAINSVSKSVAIISFFVMGVRPRTLAFAVDAHFAALVRLGLIGGRRSVLLMQLFYQSRPFSAPIPWLQPTSMLASRESLRLFDPCFQPGIFLDSQVGCNLLENYSAQLLGLGCLLCVYLVGKLIASLFKRKPAGQQTASQATEMTLRSGKLSRLLDLILRPFCELLEFRFLLLRWLTAQPEILIYGIASFLSRQKDAQSSIAVALSAMLLLLSLVWVFCLINFLSIDASSEEGKKKLKIRQLFFANLFYSQKVDQTVVLQQLLRITNQMLSSSLLVTLHHMELIQLSTVVLVDFVFICIGVAKSWKSGERLEQCLWLLTSCCDISYLIVRLVVAFLYINTETVQKTVTIILTAILSLRYLSVVCFTIVSWFLPRNLQAPEAFPKQTPSATSAINPVTLNKSKSQKTSHLLERKIPAKRIPACSYPSDPKPEQHSSPQKTIVRIENPNYKPGARLIMSRFALAENIQVTPEAISVIFKADEPLQIIMKVKTFEELDDLSIEKCSCADEQKSCGAKCRTSLQQAASDAGCSGLPSTEDDKMSVSRFFSKNQLASR